MAQLKNVRISIKLVLVGAILIVLPLVVVAVVAISRATQGLGSVEAEQLAARTSTIAEMVDRVFAEEQKAALSYSLDSDLVAAAEAFPGTAEAAPAGTGRGAASAGPSPADLAARASARLSRLMTTKGIGESYQVILAAGLDGVVFAASDPSYIGLSVSDRQYVKAALAGAVNAGAAALNKVTGKPFAPFAAPIRSGDKVVGVLALIADISFLSDIIAGEKIGKTGYAYIVDDTGLIIAHPKAENLFKTNLATLDGTKDFAKKMIAGERGVSNYVFQGVAKTAGYAPVTSTKWSVGLTLPDAEYIAAAVEIRNLLIIISIVALLAALLAYLLFSRSITKPLARGVSFAQLIAAGDLTQHLSIEQKDEIGVLAGALNTMSMKLRGTIAAIQDSAASVASASEQITASAQKLSEGAQIQASSLEESSASVEELSASVDQVAEHAQAQAAAAEQGTASMAQVHQSIEEVSKNLTEIARLAGRSVENALDGAHAVSEVVEGINLIANSSEKIGGIVTVISEIADQTNLLALNASIEAARAGEHGRGFAVVADEVSKLADRSSASTKEIVSLIDESVRNVTKGVETAKGSQTAMDQIRAASQQVKDMIAGLSESMSAQVQAVRELSAALRNVSEMSQSISAATEEQTSNAKQVSKAVESVNDVTQSSAAAAEQMSASTEQLSGMAQELQQMTAQFRIDASDAQINAARTRGIGAASESRPVKAA